MRHDETPQRSSCGPRAAVLMAWVTAASPWLASSASSVGAGMLVTPALFLVLPFCAITTLALTASIRPGQRRGAWTALLLLGAAVATGAGIASWAFFDCAGRGPLIGQDPDLICVSHSRQVTVLAVGAAGAFAMAVATARLLCRRPVPPSAKNPRS